MATKNDERYHHQRFSEIGDSRRNADGSVSTLVDTGDGDGGIGTLTRDIPIGPPVYLHTRTGIISAVPEAPADEEAPHLTAAKSSIAALQACLREAGEMRGYGIKDAGLKICEQWLRALMVNPNTELLSDVDLLILRLEAFRTKARRVLPIANGGFGGHEEDDLLSALKSAGFGIFRTQEGLYSYLGSESHFDTRAEAIVSALQDHPDVVAALEPQRSAAFSSEA
ncbi:hypothetical protein [Paracidovorax citrulli]|uniref:hypothetical protein n=1 Tax=Paracidovorax citrulli TaxID=80869 RepID=UPI003FA68E06